ncbi:MAG: type I DNA topoisomerase [Candidatus Tokpelaia sp.]|nr:MAG: type I DNA topoisomerase [Candidatus Tokpelaia sp.]KAA6207675.1 MAG: type I DNA topoisomerase [Candidatus Tokpelaia sp.]
MDIVIVESPAKAKTINKYLGKTYKVLASFGHIRDLPAKDGSVLPDDDFAMKWSIDKTAEKRVAEIAQAVKNGDKLILATDPDREGEAISWHILDVLRHKKLLKDKPIERVVFNAVTKTAVLNAMAHPRAIDANLVDAYLARRALDYLVGFTLSPVLWRKLPGARSAGRVQSVALRLICDRELEIERFIREDYWLIEALLKTVRAESFPARLMSFNGQKTGRLDIKTAAEAEHMRAVLDGARFAVTDLQAKPVKRHPAPPFTTSSLQQAASSRLSFSAARTMQIAQKLYEGVDMGGETAGLITYMRTDGVQMAPEAVAAARNAVKDIFGQNYLPASPRHYAAKAKNAQEAHEAIRPTDFQRRPEQMAAFLTKDQLELYRLIWQRALASQMCPADIERTQVDIEARNGETQALLRATGQVTLFEGFLAVYKDNQEEKKDSDSADSAEVELRLPRIEAGEAVDKEKITVSEHTTEPPPRYSEASLIKKMEELGIGRPSTYAATLTTLRDRDYILIDKRRLTPEPRGRIVTAFLENFFNRYVEYDFTADLEEKLDLISDGKLEWKNVLRDFWQNFSAAVAQTQDLRVAQVLDVLNDVLAPLIFPPRAEGGDPRLCPLCGNGRLSLKLGRYGAFIGCSNYPECTYTKQLSGQQSAENMAEPAEIAAAGPNILGQDPATGEDVMLKSGRFGPYVERGTDKQARRAGLPKGWTEKEMNLQKALALLSLPREIGPNPENGKMISAALGRYGPYILCDGQYANLDSVEEIFTVGVNRAVTLLAEKQQKGKSRSGTAAALKTLGDHPEGGVIAVYSGRYGPYVKWGKINATLPREQDPAEITLAEALELIAAKAGKSRGKTAAKGKNGGKKTGKEG